MEEVLLEELIHDGPRRHPETVLGFEEVDVLGQDVGEVGDGEEGVVCVDDVRGEAEGRLVGPRVYLDGWVVVDLGRGLLAWWWVGDGRLWYGGMRCSDLGSND